MSGGDRTAVAFRAPGEKRLDPGHLLQVDVRAIFTEYNSDVARMAIVSTPGETRGRILRGLWEVQQRTIKRGRPGARSGELVRPLGRRVDGMACTLLAVGRSRHGLGQGVRDYSVVQDARDPPILKEGMVLAIESSVVVGDEKYSVEDAVLAAKHGAENLSADLQSREMWWLIAD